VLADYIAHGTRDEGSGAERRRVLCFDRDVETAIYNTLPDHLDRLLRRHPVTCPVAFLGGRQSVEMRQVGMALTARLVGAHGKSDPGRMMMLDGSHLFPMERPLATAAAIEASLRNMAG
jgi:pimeloyl-ACP methyl ester carboxylesterase